MKSTIVPLDRPLTSAALAQVQLFRARFQELWANWESLKDLGIRLGGSFSRDDDGVVTGPGCNVDIHRLKGYYLDFRFFWADKEPTNYFKVAGLLGRHCQEHQVRSLLIEQKHKWHEAGVLNEWHGITAEEMIQVMFNGYLFHSASDLRSRLAAIQGKVRRSELAHHLLAFCIYDRMLVIRNLNWMLVPLSHESHVVRVPARA